MMKLLSQLALGLLGALEGPGGDDGDRQPNNCGLVARLLFIMQPSVPLVS